MYLYPLRFRKYGRGTFLEVNVICLVVMYTNKVLRPCHMLMLDNTFWVERLTEKTVCGSLVWKRRQQMVSWSSLALGSWKLVILDADSSGLFWVLPFSLNVIHSNTNCLDLSSDAAVKYKQTELNIIPTASLTSTLSSLGLLWNIKQRALFWLSLPQLCHSQIWRVCAAFN